MRLNEEIVELLRMLSTGNATAISAEAVEEAEHEGLVHQNGKLSLTDLGTDTLSKIQRNLISADHLPLHEEAKIAYISQRNYARFQKLSSFGLSSGVPINLKQKFPSFVVQCEETEIALEENIVKDIFVWRNSTRA